MPADPADIVLLLRGPRLGLGPPRRDLLPLYQRWMNDLRVIRTLGAPRLPLSAEAEAGWLERALTSREPIFTIYELSTLRPIGNADLRDVDHAHGTAEFGLLLGETDVWGRGYGTEATRLMLYYAFDVLGLHNVQLVVYASNPGALRAYERAGFKRVGVRRGAHKAGRRRYDAIIMDAVADDIAPSALDAVMHPAGREPEQRPTP